MHFFIDKQSIDSAYLPPSPQDIINISMEMQQKVDAVQFAVSDPCSEQGSTFTAYGAKIQSSDMVTPAYIKMRRYVAPDADNIFMAYRTLHLNGKIQQGLADDGEFYGDLQIRDILKDKKLINIVVFVARRYKGVHIGKVRFQLIEQVVLDVLPKLNADTQPAAQRPSRRNSLLSHEDLD